MFWLKLCQKKIHKKYCDNCNIICEYNKYNAIFNVVIAVIIAIVITFLICLGYNNHIEKQMQRDIIELEHIKGGWNE